jgi:hypothetical protein
VGLRIQEYEGIKSWLLFMSKLDAYRISRFRGQGDIFERAFETVSLAQQETMRAIA